MKPKKKHRRHEAKTNITPQTVLKNCFFALLISAAVGAALAALATVILLQTADPARYHGAVGLLLCSLTALLCGSVATRLSGRQLPLPCGAVSGAMLLALTLLCLPWRTGSESSALSFALHALLLPVCTAGALLAARKKRAVRRGVHRR